MHVSCPAFRDTSAAIADVRCPSCFAGKAKHISIAPSNAGHLIGGSIWRIMVNGEDIVYAVDYNQRFDRHLAGAKLIDLCSRPALLITDARSASQQAGVRSREEVGDGDASNMHQLDMRIQMAGLRSCVQFGMLT